MFATRHLPLALLLAASACTVSPTPEFIDAGLDAFAAPDTGTDAGPQCAPGERLCDGVCRLLRSDPMNCGACGNVCPEGVGCVGSVCSCYRPRLACDGECIDPQSDPMNCGACGNVCPAGGSCIAGVCLESCEPPRQICLNPAPADTGDGGGDAGAARDGGAADGGVGRTPVCTDLQTDVRNCGRCNTRCGEGGTCVGGRCTCPSGMSGCGGRCVDLSSDPEHCGVCGNECGTGGTCEGGVCTSCGSDRVACDDRCVDVMTNPYHCGSCRRACDRGEACEGGRCTCMAPLVDCGEGCVNLESDPTHCGACGTNCGPGGVCSDGTCTCAPGLSMCGGSCRDTQTDPSHCGGCDMACPAGQVCIMGACSDAPPTRYRQTAPSPELVPFVDACAVPGHMEILAMRDDGSMLIPLPFPFRYWATDLPMGAMINVTTNGWIGMDGMSSATLSGTVPSPTAPNAVIAPHWGDNYTRGPICVATVGTAPGRQLVIEWNDTYYCCGDTGTVHNTFEVILSEGSGLIDFVYQTMTGTRAQTMGIEDQTGTMGINACPGGTGTCTPTSGQRVRFEPIP